MKMLIFLISLLVITQGCGTLDLSIPSDVAELQSVPDHNNVIQLDDALDRAPASIEDRFEPIATPSPILSLPEIQSDITLPYQPPVIELPAQNTHELIVVKCKMRGKNYKRARICRWKIGKEKFIRISAL